MKVTIDIPDEVYRLAKAKSALEGRAIRKVAEELFRSYLEPGEPRNPEGGGAAGRAARPTLPGGAAVPAWFGALRGPAERARRHDLEAIRESIGQSLASERDP